MFDNSKLNYAIIDFPGHKIEGDCPHWEISSNGGFVKLIIEDAVSESEYIVSIDHVLLMEKA